MKLFIPTAMIALMLASASQAAPVTPSGLSEQRLIEVVKGGRGHGGFKGNRGRHLGWYKGRGNPHRRWR